MDFETGTQIKDGNNLAWFVSRKINNIKYTLSKELLEKVSRDIQESGVKTPDPIITTKGGILTVVTTQAEGMEVKKTVDETLTRLKNQFKSGKDVCDAVKILKGG